MEDTRTKIIGSIGLCVFMLIVLIIDFYKYVELQEHGKYAIAEITSDFYTKGVRKETWYKFTIRNKSSFEEFKGVNSPFFSKRKRTVNKGEQYLVVYSEKNPKNSSLLLDRPVNESLNLDSLNNAGVDINDITFWHK